MAPAYGGSQRSGGGVSVSSFNMTNLVVDASADRMVLCFIHFFNDQSKTVSSVTFNGVGFTQIRQDDYNQGFPKRDVLLQLIAPANTTANVAVTLSGTVASAVVGNAMYFKDTLQTLITSGACAFTGVATGTTMSVSITVPSNGLGVSVMEQTTGTQTRTATSPQTAIFTTNQNNRGLAGGQDTATGTYAIGWTISAGGDDRSMYGIPLEAAAAGAETPRRRALLGVGR